MVGINNRNLRDFTVSLDLSEQLCQRIPKEKMTVAESGISSHDDIVRLRKAGINVFLVGETLMRQADVGAATRELLERLGQAIGMTEKLTHLNERARRAWSMSPARIARAREAVAEGYVVMAPGDAEPVPVGSGEEGRRVRRRAHRRHFGRQEDA